MGRQKDQSYNEERLSNKALVMLKKTRKRPDGRKLSRSTSKVVVLLLLVVVVIIGTIL